MTSYYKENKNVEYPNLKFEVSNEIEYYLRTYFLDASKADIIFLRKMALDHLKCADITQKSYKSGKQEFLVTDAIYLSINELYNTNHSWGDIDKYVNMVKTKK